MTNSLHLAIMFHNISQHTQRVEVSNRNKRSVALRAKRGSAAVALAIVDNVALAIAHRLANVIVLPTGHASSVTGRRRLLGRVLLLLPVVVGGRRLRGEVGGLGAVVRAHARDQLAANSNA